MSPFKQSVRVEAPVSAKGINCLPKKLDDLTPRMPLIVNPKRGQPITRYGVAHRARVG
jgi:hypothetical protein